MQIFRDISSLQLSLNKLILEQKTIGLVPTMGALHNGHAALLEASLLENDITVCSIFVNPTQFNNDEDLNNYPRTYEEDIKFLESNGCDIVFSPSIHEMYPEPPRLKFNFGKLEQSMEGKFRPGHFNGVAIVVSKLFNIVNPKRSYFGQKDLQQFRIIKELVRNLAFNTELRQVPIKRDESGLAMSSRNKRLSSEGLNLAVKLNQSLMAVKKSISDNQDFEKTKILLVGDLALEGIQVEYLEYVNADSLESVKNNSTNNSVALCIAATVDGVRLIDNIIFELRE